MSVLYATSRLNEGNWNNPKYGGARHLDIGSGSLDFGVCQVKRPPRPVPFENAPDWLSYRDGMKVADTEWQNAPVSQGRLLSQSDFCKRVHDFHGVIMLFIHGYDETFETSMRDAAVLGNALANREWQSRTEVLPILFSWPSAGNLRDYSVDESNLEWSSDSFAQFVEALCREKSSDSSIVVVAHSLGTRLFFSLLNNTDLLETKPFSKLVLSASDYDYYQALGRIEGLERLVDREVYVFVSDRDGPLVTSQLIHGSPRLGRPFDPPRLSPNVADYRSSQFWKNIVDDAADVVFEGGLTNPPEAAIWLSKRPGIDKELGAKSRFVDVSELVSADFGHRIAWPLIAGLVSTSGSISPLATTFVYKRPDRFSLQQSGGIPRVLYRFHRIDANLYGSRSPQ